MSRSALARSRGRAGEGGHEAGHSKQRRLSRKHSEWVAGYLFIAPDCVGLLVFVGIPMVFSFVIGFFHASGFGGYDFVGFDNYRRMAHDPVLVKSALITVVYVAVFVPLLFSVSLALALLVRKKRPLVGLFRSLFFAPNVVSLIVVGLVWQFLLVDRIGVVNRALNAVGLSGRSWLGDPHLALGTVLVISVWFFMGYYMTIFLAGLQDIPRDYYEAAKIEGAGRLATFRMVTWPLLKPTSLFVLMLSAITGVGGLQAFDLIYIMTKGGPDNGTQLVIFYIYQQAFQFNDFGYAAAMSSFVVFVLLLAMIAMFRLTRGGRFHVD
ncbi:MAG: carbohydrate ABC transporter permease [Nocardioidaceae bacterium]